MAGGAHVSSSALNIQRHLTSKKLTKIKLHILDSERRKKDNLMLLIKQNDEFDRLFGVITKKVTTMFRNREVSITPKDFTLGYYDEEGEMITMTDDDDWEIAKVCAGGEFSSDGTNVVSDIKLWMQLRREFDHL
ncbi:hypothetical protein EV182_007250 [Spiromyces aspiralis]|uniref:Uncharacterized protein n=1 Tax=Spiromyces aspiralis TaxID=68401 RepID=A0ACC1HNE5_9FUNG|nr:hypothetical protein EV182_007250 [Spiromyces aspiralis]